MTIELIVGHGLDADWLSTRPINVLFDLYTAHIRALTMNPMLFGMGGHPQEDRYSSKTWVEESHKPGTKTKVSRVNLLNSDDVKVIDELRGKK
jgi:hypothetical protein